jgi:hypothetical protein
MFETNCIPTVAKLCGLWFGISAVTLLSLDLANRLITSQSSVCQSGLGDGERCCLWKPMTKQSSATAELPLDYEPLPIEHVVQSLESTGLRDQCRNRQMMMNQSVVANGCFKSSHLLLSLAPKGPFSKRLLPTEKV